jgi:hypothetical protein
VQLRYISRDLLVAQAGGDPWAIDKSLQSGRPAQISDLAHAFHNAGKCTKDADTAFVEACRRFETSWNRKTGEHPINDSAEVQRATTSLGVQAAQLPKIAVDLENIAATLAQAQRTSGTLISTLESQLQQTDTEIGEAVELEKNPNLSAHDKHVLDQHITQLEDQAIDDTKATLGQAKSIRTGYSDYLQKSLTNLRTEDGYDPAPIQGVDSDEQPSRDEQDHKAVDRYNANQHAKDQALVDSPGGMTPEKEDAATRLRDYAAATDPGADADARRLASERLDDFNVAHFTGPLPVDPILGVDARSRAQTRLEWQKKLEQGFAGGPRMTPNQVTQMLDNSEQQGRAVVTQQAIKALEREGMSPAGASRVVGRAASGVPWQDLVKQNSQMLDAMSNGADGYLEALPTNPQDWDGLSVSDAKAIKSFSKYAGHASTLLDALITYDEIKHGAPKGQAIGQFLGGTALSGLGTWGTAITVSTVAGPEATFLTTMIAGIATGQLGNWAGGTVGKVFDR